MDLLQLAKEVAERVETEASRIKVAVSVTVADPHGNVVLQHRMNGALGFSMLFSERKAYTSAMTRKNTSDIFPLVQPGKELFHMMSQERFCAMGGGAPLDLGGDFYGAVGVSGGTVDEDVSILERALKIDWPIEGRMNLTLQPFTHERANSHGR